METGKLVTAWQEESLDVITGMAEWRVQHPKATLREIEAALDERMARLRARMLEDAALASAAREWEAGADGPQCPDCHVVLKPGGHGERHLQSTGRAEVVLERRYGVCPVCGTGFFPPG